MKNMDELKSLWQEMSYFRALELILMWDQWTALPAAGIQYRARLSGYVAGKSSELLKTDRAARIYAEFSDADPAEAANDMDRAIMREVLHACKAANAVPTEIVSEYAELTQKSQAAWMEALQKKDYSIFKPFLAKQFELAKRRAEFIDPNRPALEVLAGECDQDISAEVMVRELAKLRDGVSALVKRIAQSDVEIDDSFIPKQFDEKEFLELTKKLAQEMGYDLEKGSFAEVQHPFTCIVGPKDARITGNGKFGFKFGLFAALHEAGHAMYAYGGSKEIDDADLWGGVPGSFHEAQSRFYENMVGKSREYCTAYLPVLAETYPSLRGITPEQFYRAVNKVEPSIKRITADEVTYSLHPIIRFELEKELFDGTVSFDELPEAWNEKYRSYLGVTPKDDAEGCLQDIHWAAGSLAYFQSYVIGNIYGAQIRRALLKAVPDAWEAIGRRDFAPLNNWRNENIHQYGLCYTGTEILRRISGEELDASAFVDYLNKKYSDIYGLRES